MALHEKINLLGPAAALVYKIKPVEADMIAVVEAERRRIAKEKRDAQGGKDNATKGNP